MEAADDDEAPHDAASPSRALELQREDEASRGYDLENYLPHTATPTERLDLLVHLRTINPLYGVYLPGTWPLLMIPNVWRHSKARLKFPAMWRDLCACRLWINYPQVRWPQLDWTTNCSNSAWQRKPNWSV